MRILLSLIIGLNFIITTQSNAQSDDLAEVKLFVELVDNTCDELTKQQKALLRDRLIQVISRTGIANIGYSNFLVYPDFFVLEQTTQENGLKIFDQVRCEIVLHLSRTNLADMPGAIMSTYSLKVSAIAEDREQAITKAIRSLRPSDDKIQTFLTKAKQDIFEYYEENCTAIMDEATQAYRLQDRARALAILLSVPYGVDCYDSSREVSIKMYGEFLGELCDKSVLKLKTMSTLARDPSISLKEREAYHKDMMEIVEELNEAATCFDEVFNIMDELSSQISEDRRLMWETEKLRIEKEAEKEDVLLIGATQMAGTVVPQKIKR